MSVLYVQKLTEDARVPTKNNPEDAGYDLYANENVKIEPMQQKSILTGIAVAIPPGCYGRVASRSGLSVKYNLEVGAGVIDRGYSGEVKVVLRNFSELIYEVKKGDKIAQLILERYENCPLEVVADVKQTMQDAARGAKGFGSSG